MPPPDRTGATRRTFTLSTVINLAVLAAFIAVGGVGLYQTVKAVYANKLGDTLAIAYLELEARGHKLSARLAKTQDAYREADAALVLRLEGDNLAPVRGDLRKPIPLRSLGLTSLAFDDKLTVLALAGRSYVARARAGSLYLWPCALDKQLAWPRAKDSAVAYVLTKQGKLVFSSQLGLDDTNAERRPLVQSFISAPLRQGQFELPDLEGEKRYGLFQEIPETNLVLFQELGIKRLASALKAVNFGFLSGFAFVVMAVLLGLQLPLQALSRRAAYLARTADELARSGRSLTPIASRFAEIQNLSAALERTGARLRAATAATETAPEAATTYDPSVLTPARREVLASFLAAAKTDADWCDATFTFEDGPIAMVAAGVVSRGDSAADALHLVKSAFRELSRQRSQPTAVFDAAHFFASVNSALHTLAGGKWVVNVQVLVAGATDSYTAFSAGFSAPFGGVSLAEHMTGPALGRAAELALIPAAAVKAEAG